MEDEECKHGLNVWAPCQACFDEEEDTYEVPENNDWETIGKIILLAFVMYLLSGVMR
jgi:hypothetical protein